jgi:hypothetical protein
MKITSDLTNLTTTTAILILTVQMFFEWTLLPYRGCLNVHEKNMENMFPTKKINYFYYYY